MILSLKLESLAQSIVSKYKELRAVYDSIHGAENIITDKKASEELLDNLNASAEKLADEIFALHKQINEESISLGNKPIPLEKVEAASINIINRYV